MISLANSISESPRDVEIKPGFVVVSVHDVACFSEPQIRQQIDSLRSWGVSQTSLLLIPRYHGKEKMEDETLSPSFLPWLRQLQAEGHEIVLHGWEHQNPSTSRRRGLRTWYYENYYTHREAEFLNFDYAETRRRLEWGLTLFHELGIQPRGFIAPAWLMNPNVETAAKDLGFCYSNTISELILLQRGTRFSCRTCVWATRTGWRRRGSLLWNPLLFRALKQNPLLRISLHPNDIRYPEIWSQVEALIKQALKTRIPTTYSNWVETFG